MAAVAIMASGMPALSQPSADRVGLEVEGIGIGVGSLEHVLLRVEEEPTGRLLPLLPYIFFEDGSSDIPARYVHPDSASTVDPFVRQYHAIMSIVARRMRENPRERLVITGTSSMRGRDRRGSVARARATRVAEYMASTLGVDRARLVVRSVALPSEASNNAHAEGQAENRRVELSGSTVLLAPVRIADPHARIASDGMRVIPSTSLPADIREWWIEMRHDGGLFRRLHGTGGISPLYTETFTPTELARFAASPTGIDVVLRGMRGVGDTIVLATRTIALRAERTRRAMTPADGRAQDRESIILFGFNSAQIRWDSEMILLDLIERIPATATLRVTGFTDETGDSLRNEELSQARADAVRAAMPTRVTSARGSGESGGHHWNSRPEDRFYSRTARLFVEF